MCACDNCFFEWILILCDLQTWILRNMTLEEAFSEVKPVVGHLRIFGCLVYIHVPKEKRTKLYPSCRKGTFVGYNESSKAYQIYIPG
jgi:hypothetical protein